MGVEKIKKDMERFEISVRKLSSEISKASVLWKDDQFMKLNTSVQKVAAQSKDLMVAGSNCCSSVGKFDQIAQEEI